MKSCADGEGFVLMERGARLGLGVLGRMATAKKATKKSSGDGQACWPGFKRVPGTKAGAKGSCEPKERQTAAEKKADGRAAAASKREKAGRR